MRAVLVSFRLVAADGVSVEAAKWAAALRRLGWTVHTVGGAGLPDLLVPGLDLDAPRPPVHPGRAGHRPDRPAGAAAAQGDPAQERARRHRGGRAAGRHLLADRAGGGRLRPDAGRAARPGALPLASRNPGWTV